MTPSDSTPPRPYADDDQERAGDPRSEHITGLRAALQRAIPLLSYCAGREAATDPTQAAVLVEAISDMTDVLARTEPASHRAVGS
jgi:hypothetical protein